MQPLNSTITPASIINYDQLLNAFLENKSWDAQYRLIIQLGKTLSSLPEHFKNEKNQVKGCESLAWLIITFEGEYYNFQMDSDTRVVKGLMKVIWIIFQGKTQQQIRELNCENLLKELGLLNHLSPSRANGLFAIVNVIKGI